VWDHAFKAGDDLTQKVRGVYYDVSNAFAGPWRITVDSPVLVSWRHAVTGNVTYAGKPLAAGRISFEPDTERGNKGPAGYGDIVDGKYETYRTMGAVGGSHRVVIEGYSGSTPEQRRKRSPLFPPHITTVDLPLEKTAVDFDIPTAKSPGRKSEDRRRISAGR
jgi:hypothetical protein